MSVRNLESTTQSAKTLYAVKDEVISAQSKWTRNPAWPAITIPSSSDEKIVGLFAVPPGESSGKSSYFACTLSGNYTVDFGDGSSANKSAGVAAEHRYTFNSNSLYDATVTFTDSGDLITRNSHGYADGDTVNFYRIVSTTGLTEGVSYYVINATTNTFQVSETLGGNAVALTTNGSGSLLPYKIATVVITPQSGQNLTAVDLSKRHSELASVAKNYTVDWLDIAISVPNATTLKLVDTTKVEWFKLERFRLVNASNVASFENMCRNMVQLGEVVVDEGAWASVTNLVRAFNGCSRLNNISLPKSIGATTVNMGFMFNSCYSLTTLPAIDTSKATNLDYFISNCVQLVEVPFLDTSAATSTFGMFGDCRRLVNFPDIDTSSSQNMRNMFYNCWNMIEAPALDTSSCTNFQAMFSSCYSLRKVPLYDMSSATTAASMFHNCASLKEVPKFNTSNISNLSYFFFNSGIRRVPAFDVSNATNIQGMFAYCGYLEEAPPLNTSSATSFDSLFIRCKLLTTTPVYDTTSCTRVTNMYNECTSLMVIPALDLSRVTSGAFQGFVYDTTPSLQRCLATGAKYTIEFRNLGLTADALDEIYTNLGTADGTQYVYVNGNPGVTGHSPSIATAKGWVVVY